MNEIPKWSMPTLAYHEGVPGHHFQISIAQELKGLPQFRKLIPFTAYQEGWALYTEWLAKEAGWYEGDPFGDLGRLQAELFRAVRLVVDTGIHAKRWPREQAIAYMREKTGMGEKEVTAEIERYIVNPGPGLRLQSRNAEDPGITDARANGTGNEVRSARIPRRRAQEWRVAARDSRGAGDGLHSRRNSEKQVEASDGLRNGSRRQRISSTLRMKLSPLGAQLRESESLSICSLISWTKLAAPAPFTTR